MKEKLSMEVIHPKAAGIDIGSRSHFVAIGQGEDQVKEFGVFTEDHDQAIKPRLRNRNFSGQINRVIP